MTLERLFEGIVFLNLFFLVLNGYLLFKVKKALSSLNAYVPKITFKKYDRDSEQSDGIDMAELIRESREIKEEYLQYYS